MIIPEFAKTLIAWQKKSGRHDLPWQGTRDPYRIWVSEIMLQQTQVSTVSVYYPRFLQRFPSVDALAEASLDEVLAYWSGLGYYARGRNLHRAAQRIVEDFAGQWPLTLEGLMSLPGIGRSTAAAILVFATGAKAAILDGNVKRVLCRSHGIEGYPGLPAIEKNLWQLAEDLLPDQELEIYIQALMDLGATLCVRRRARCPDCPVRESCRALATDRVELLPTPKPKSGRAKRSGTFWWVLNESGELWLDRRPESGIWGGLWCFPEKAPDQALVRGPTVTLHHELTHFTWMISVHPVTVSGREALSPTGQWLSLTAACGLGLPAPIRELLAAPART